MNRGLLLTFTGLLLLILPGPARSQAGQMVHHVPKESRIEREKGTFSFDKDAMSRKEAEGVAGYLHKRYGEDESVSIYKIPGFENYYLVSGSMGYQGETDYGVRFFLVKKEGNDYVQLFRGRGAGDSYNLDPVFYAAKDRVLILAESGAEYSWGLSAYEFKEERLATLGYLSVARWSGENYVNPLDRVTVFLRDGRYVVEFATNLRLNPGGLHPWWLVRAKKNITFIQKGNSFILSGDSVGNQVCFCFLREPVTDDDNEILSDLDHYYNQLIPWWEKNLISHSFQTNLPLRMIPKDGHEVLIGKEELPMDIGVVLMDRQGRKKVLNGVHTDVDLIFEMEGFFGN